MTAINNWRMKIMRVITNNHWRPFIYGHELTESEQAEFDYLDKEELMCRQFIRYKGNLIDTGEIIAVSTISLPGDAFSGWHGHQPDSFFSGILIKFSDDCESYQIATYIV